MIAVSVLSPDEWRAWRDLRLQALAQDAHAFGSTLEEWQDASDERWQRRLRDVPLNAIAYLDGQPAGLVAATAPDTAGTTDLISMWVAPFARGRGVGDALIQAVVEWAEGQGLQRVALDVVASNGPATALYERNGFSFVDDAPDCAKCERRMARIISANSPAAS